MRTVKIWLVPCTAAALLVTFYIAAAYHTFYATPAFVLLTGLCFFWCVRSVSGLYEKRFEYLLSGLAEAETDLEARCVRVLEERRQFSDELGEARREHQDTAARAETERSAAQRCETELQNAHDRILNARKLSAEHRSAIDELSRSISESWSDIESVHRVVNTFRDSLGSVTDHLNDLVRAVHTSSDMIESGLASVALSHEAVRSISQRVAEITGLNHQILEISEKTNLLSLNASIEAARAGSAGRGFAVVAEHIGRLAEHAQGGVQNIKAAADAAADAVTGGISASGALEETFASIVRQVAEVQKVSDQVREMIDSLLADGAVMFKHVDHLIDLAMETKAASTRQRRNAEGIEQALAD